ncbi:MAG: sigma-70 family RNA polymerase sigma factor [Chloroflexi bacterium]|nr:sigma-70 family RNA polymerase sigma factor [Chloroflexota bacterium]
MMDMQTLIEEAANGSEAACEALYRRFVKRAYRLAYGVLLNHEDAEEVVQDSFAYAFRTLYRFNSEKSSFKTWLYTITMSRCRNKRRRKLLPTVALADVADWLAGGGPSPEREVAAAGVRETVFAALRQLSPKLREAVILRYFDEMTYREMGAVLGCSPKTAESRVRLAHNALYEILAAQPDALPDGVFGHAPD